MATELREYLNNIVEEKNAKVIPTNIRKGITLYGVEGTLEEGIDTTDATAVASNILQGETAYVNDTKIEGTMANNAELTYSPSDEEQEIPEGYTTGGKVEATDITRLNEYQACLTLANSIENLEDFSDTTATAGDILEGKTAYSNGEKLVGIMKANDNTAILDGTLYIAGTTNIPLMIKSISKIVFPEGNAGSIFNGCSNLEYIGEIDSSATNYMDSIFEKCAKLKELPYFDTSNCSTMRNCCSGCSSLISIPILNTAKFTGMGLYYSFYNCSNLSDESLNNIMQMCIDATGLGASYKTLKQVGLSSAQVTRCQSLSNWQALLNAGWTTGY